MKNKSRAQVETGPATVSRQRAASTPPSTHPDLLEPGEDLLELGDNVALDVLEEALDCVLTRVRWYCSRGHRGRIPKATREAFNTLCDVLGKPEEKPWRRL